jgi:hypothetical protein
MNDDETILGHLHQGVNVLGLLWACLGLVPTSIAVATLELPSRLAASLWIAGLVTSILLDVWWRFSSDPDVGWRRFYRLSAGGCLLWMPYWLSWFVMIPLVVAISLLRR